MINETLSYKQFPVVILAVSNFSTKNNIPTCEVNDFLVDILELRLDNRDERSFCKAYTLDLVVYDL